MKICITMGDPAGVELREMKRSWSWQGKNLEEKTLKNGLSRH